MTTITCEHGCAVEYETGKVNHVICAKGFDHEINGLTLYPDNSSEIWK